jgi:hypothetical protein
MVIAYLFYHYRYCSLWPADRADARPDLLSIDHQKLNIKQQQHSNNIQKQQQQQQQQQTNTEQHKFNKIPNENQAKIVLQQFQVL